MLPLTWIEQRLAERGLTIEQLVQLEAQQQAADQVSIGNSIGSLRFLGAIDWREFVEDDERGRADPARGPGRRLRRHGLRHARPLPPRGRADRAAQRAVGKRSRARKAIELALRAHRRRQNGAPTTAPRERTSATS